MSDKVKFTKIKIKQLVALLDPKPRKIPSYKFTGKTFYENEKKKY